MSAAHAVFRTPPARPARLALLATPGPLTGPEPAVVHGVFFDMVPFPFSCPPMSNSLRRAPIRNKRNV